MRQSFVQTLVIIFVLLWGLFAAAPNFMSDSTRQALSFVVPQDTVSLGLDLQGGSHLLLEVDMDDYMKDQYESYADDIRRAFRKQEIRVRSSVGSADQIKVSFSEKVAEGKVREIIRPLSENFEYKWVDDLVLILNFSDQAITEFTSLALEQSIEIVRRRVDETGTKEPVIQRQGKDRIIVQLPGVKDPDRIKALLGKTAKLSFHIVKRGPLLEKPNRVSPTELLVENGEGNGFYLIHRRVSVKGEYLTNALPNIHEGRPVVSFRFDSRGAKRFGQVTLENQGERLAIVLDNKVISAPSIDEPILQGSGIIRGSFTTNEAKDLAILLRSGALPAPLTVLEERTVGPSLGADSIASGKVASMIGLAFVIVFMVIAYRLFGLIANIALFVNMMLILGALSFLQATLTLPGIAGIVLTIGMAVDANVLIFERIREEVGRGRKLAVAIQDGYQRALKTIIDANLTTFFAAFLLFSFGSGPIKGFAVTLTIGLITSMFSALLVTKSLIVLWYNKAKPKSLPLT